MAAEMISIFVCKTIIGNTKKTASAVLSVCLQNHLLVA